MADRGYADVTEALFEEFGNSLSLSTITAVVAQHRLWLRGVTRVVDPTELEDGARLSLQELLNTTPPSTSHTTDRATTD